MNDRGRILFGLLIFLILMTFPIWYNLLNGVTAMPELIVPTKDVPGKDRCVRSVEYMRPYHMDLLNEWRDVVVREGHRIYVAEDGRKFNMSLSNTCLDCHANKEEFCDRCHTYMEVSPYCWDCHLEPQVTELAVQERSASDGN
ncbi:MAG: sulfate reduction electron transfer complex DsrMKJOP subunit DsrJ [bacterium]